MASEFLCGKRITQTQYVQASVAESTELEWTWDWEMWANEVPILWFWSAQEKRTFLTCIINKQDRFLPPVVICVVGTWTLMSCLSCVDKVLERDLGTANSVPRSVCSLSVTLRSLLYVSGPNQPWHSFFRRALRWTNESQDVDGSYDCFCSFPVPCVCFPLLWPELSLEKQVFWADKELIYRWALAIVFVRWEEARPAWRGAARV